MASLNGVSLKNVKRFNGHEGEPLMQGTIYINGKKLGFWSQDSWGGCDTYENRSVEAAIRSKAEEFARGFDKNAQFAEIQAEPDVFMGHLTSLIEDERIFKNFAKQGAVCTVYATSGFNTTAIGYRNVIKEIAPELREKLRKNLYGEIKAEYIVTDARFFDVMVNAELPAPKYMIGG